MSKKVIKEGYVVRSILGEGPFMTVVNIGDVYPFYDMITCHYEHEGQWCRETFHRNELAVISTTGD